MEIQIFLLRIGVALVGGLFIGFERELQEKHAGLKTNALVALGAAVFVLASLQFKGEDYVDVTRVLGQVVTGIGFIGAGVILHTGGDVKGLTTAATVWTSAGCGCLAGFGMYAEVVAVVFAILFINTVLARVNVFIDKYSDRGNDRKKDDS